MKSLVTLQQQCNKHYIKYKNENGREIVTKNEFNLLWCSFPNISLDRIVQLLEAVGILLHAVNTYKPVLRGVSLLEVVKFDVLVANLNITCPVEPRRSAEIQLYQQQSTTFNEAKGSQLNHLCTEACLLLFLLRVSRRFS